MRLKHTRFLRINRFSLAVLFSVLLFAATRLTTLAFPTPVVRWLTFLKGEGTADEATAYYNSIAAPPTFSDWKSQFGFNNVYDAPQNGEQWINAVPLDSQGSKFAPHLCLPCRYLQQDLRKSCHFERRRSEKSLIPTLASRFLRDSSLRYAPFTRSSNMRKSVQVIQTIGFYESTEEKL